MGHGILYAERAHCFAVDDDLAAALSNEIYEISKGQREKELSAGQAFVYSGSACTYVNIEGGN